MSCPRYYFVIKSQWSGLVLDVYGSNASPGAWVSTWGNNDTNAQRWWEDPVTGTIRSKINGFCLDIEGGRLVLNPYEPGKEDQLWERKGKLLVDRRYNDKVLDIADNNKEQEANLIKATADGTLSQNWTFELV